MPKVSVTMKTNRTQRTYKGDYAYVSVMNENGVGDRWEQEPANWKGGLGLFFCGMSALRTVAEQKGKEGFKEAARSAMEAMSLYDPDCSSKQKEINAKKLLELVNKTLGVSSKGTKRGKKGKEDVEA